MLAPESQIITGADKRVRQMADTMRAVGPDLCTEAVLLAEGYSRHELELYGPAARQLAEKQFVRNVAAGPRETDAELLTIATGHCAGLVGEVEIVAALRRAGFAPATIARLWDRLMPKVASHIGKTVATLPRPAAQRLAEAV